jgi:hypothetical protein
MLNEIQHIISGKGKVRFGATIQTIAGYLTRSQTASPMAKEDKHFKAEETKRLEIIIAFIKPTISKS